MKKSNLQNFQYATVRAYELPKPAVVSEAEAFEGARELGEHPGDVTGFGLGEVHRDEHIPLNGSGERV
jgi:hypothetical protein